MIPVLLLLISLVSRTSSWAAVEMPRLWSNFTAITPPVVLPPLLEPPLGPEVPDRRPSQVSIKLVFKSGDEQKSLLTQGLEEDEDEEATSYFVRRRAQSTIAYYYVGGNFRLVQGNLVGTINLPASWTVQFDLYPVADGVDWRSIVHLTTGGDGVPGGRLPGVWFCHVGVGATICPTMGLHIAIMNAGVTWESNIYVWTQQAIPFHAWSTVSITIDAVNLLMTASVSGAINLPARSTVFSKPNLNSWPNVQVFCSDPWHLPGAANIRNLYINSFPAVLSTPATAPVTYWPTTSFPNGRAFFAGDYLGTVALPPSYSLSWDMYPTADGADWRNVLLLTVFGVDSATAGGRLPGVWLCHSHIGPFCPSMGLHIAYVASGTNWVGWAGIFFQKPLPLNAWSTVTITIDSVNLLMDARVDGAVSIPPKSTVIPQPQQASWPRVHFYAASPWWSVSEGLGRNMQITDLKATLQSPLPLAVSFWPSTTFPTGRAIYSGNLFGVVSLPQSYTLTFDLSPYQDGTDWRNVVILTITSGDCDRAGCRLPSIWFCHVAMGVYCPSLGLHFSYVGSGALWTGWAGLVTQKGLPLNKWSTVSVTIDGVNNLMTAGVTGAVTILPRTTVVPQASQSSWPKVYFYAAMPWSTPADAYIRNVMITSLDAVPLVPSHLPDQLWPSTTFPNGRDMYQGNYMGTVAIPASYSISWDMNPYSTGIDNWRSVLHLTSFGTDCGTAGCRLPGVWLCHPAVGPYCPTMGLHVAYVASGTAWSGWAGIFFQKPLPLNAWTTITITVDGINNLLSAGSTGAVTVPPKFTLFPAPTQTTWPAVHVYFSNPWSPDCQSMGRNLAIVDYAASLIVPSTLPDVIYPTELFPTGRDVYQGGYLGQIALPDEYFISFDLYPIAVGTPTWRNILHLTATGGDANGAGSRLPGVWFCDQQMGAACPVMGVHASHIGSGSIWEYNAGIITSQGLPLNAWSTVVITVNTVSRLMTLCVSGAVSIQGQIVQFQPAQSTWARVHVYASNPWYYPAEAKMRNLGIYPPLQLPGDYYPSVEFSSGFNIFQGNLLAMLALPDVFTVSFDLFPSAVGTPTWRSILHLSATGGDYQGAGSRIPGIWFCDHHMGATCPVMGIAAMHIGSGQLGETQAIVWGTQSLPLNAWSTVTVTINSNTLLMGMSVSGALRAGFGMTSFPLTSRAWPAVKVYASDPWYTPAIANIRNLVIEAPSDLNVVYYPSFSFPSGFSVFSGNIVGLVNLPSAYSLTFDLLSNSVVGVCSNILHLTATGMNVGVAGSRLPALFFCTGASMTLSSSLIASPTNVNSGGISLASRQPIAVGTWTTVTVTIDFSVLVMTLSTATLTLAGNATSNGPPASISFPSTVSQLTWHAVQVMCSDGWYASAPVSVRNVVIQHVGPSASPTPFPTSSPSPEPTAVASVAPVFRPTPRPTVYPTVLPSALPTRVPSAAPSALPTVEPSPYPSARPTINPTPAPSRLPTSDPTLKSDEPSPPPTAMPTAPSPKPSSLPTREPTPSPTFHPSAEPTALSTHAPTPVPSSRPTVQPSPRPSAAPTAAPSTFPTVQPSPGPTVPPGTPSAEPTALPTRPTAVPTTTPTLHPSPLPTTHTPTYAPTPHPTTPPTLHPSSQPTERPSPQPSPHPTLYPTAEPTARPSVLPSPQPTTPPTRRPTIHPSPSPSPAPSHHPTSLSTVYPTERTKEPSPRPTTVFAMPGPGVPSSAGQPGSGLGGMPGSGGMSPSPGVPSSAGHPRVVPGSVQPGSGLGGMPEPRNGQLRETPHPSPSPSPLPSSAPSPSPTRAPYPSPTSEPSPLPFAQPTTSPTHSPTVSKGVSASGLQSSGGGDVSASDKTTFIAIPVVLVLVIAGLVIYIWRTQRARIQTAYEKWNDHYSATKTGAPPRTPQHFTEIYGSEQQSRSQTNLDEMYTQRLSIQREALRRSMPPTFVANPLMSPSAVPDVTFVPAPTRRLSQVPLSAAQQHYDRRDSIPSALAYPPATLVADIAPANDAQVATSVADRATPAPRRKSLARLV